MKDKLMDSLSVGNRMISENSNITNKKMVVTLLSLFSFIDDMFKDQQATLIYYGDNPLTFLTLFIASFLFGHKVIKVVDMEQLQDKILESENPIVFVDKIYYSEDIIEVTKFKSFAAFLVHNLTFNLKLGTTYGIYSWDYMKKKQEEYGSRDHGMLIGMIKSLHDGLLFIDSPIVLELPTSGIHSPAKHVGFSRHNITSIVRLITRLPHLMGHDAIRLFASIESSFFYMLSVYVNQKTMLTNVTSRNTISVELYSQRQATILDSVHMMYLWNVMIKDYIFSNKYQFFNRRFTRWIIGLKVRRLLRSYLGRSLKSLYIINADLPIDVKQLLRRSFLKVVYLYGIRETGNIIGSNIKKDKLPFDSYRIENHEDDIRLVDDEVTGVLFIKGNAVADTLQREVISNTVEEDEIYVNTHDIAHVDKGIVNFLTPIGTALSTRESLNFDLYFAERSLLLLPEVLHTVSFEYQHKWYIGVQVDEGYLDRMNLNLSDITNKLEDIRQKMNTYLPATNAISSIDVSTEYLILNTEGRPVRWAYKWEEASV